MIRRFGTALSALIVFGATFLAGGVPAGATITPSSTAQQIANAISPTGASVTGTFVSKPPSGTPDAVAETVADPGSALTSFPTDGSSYGILTTGDANQAANAQQSNFASANDGGGNVRGNSDYDVSILKVDLTAAANQTCLHVDFRFLSEEFPEFVGSSYNDAFIAELDTSNWTTSGSTITAPNNFAFDPDHNPITINSTGSTHMTAAEAASTVYDGATPLLVAQTPITAGPHSVYFSIFDDGDQVYDSAVFLDNLFLGTESGPDCVKGAKPNLALSLTVDHASTPTGVTAVSLSQIPPTGIVQRTPPTQDAPIGKSPIGKSPIGKSPIGKSPIGKSPIGKSPIGKSPIGKSPIGKSPIGKSPIGKSPVSAFPLLRPGGWQQVLADSCDFQTAVPQGVTLAQLLTDSCIADGNTSTFPELSPPEALPDPLADKRLTLDQINWALSPAANASMLALLLGDVTWNDVAGNWCPEWLSSGQATCPGPAGSGLQLSDSIIVTESNGLNIERTSLPVKTVGDITDPTKTFFWGITLIDLNIHGSFLGNVKLSDTPDPNKVADCTRVNCSTATLGDAYDNQITAGDLSTSALKDTATFADLGPSVLEPRTLSDVTIAFLDPNAINWEDVPLSGMGLERLPGNNNPTNLLQYSLSYEVPCADSAGMQATVKLPNGFVYRPGSSTQFEDSIDDPTSDGNGGLVWDLTSSSCADTGDEQIEIDFQVMPGFSLGTFTSDASVKTDTTSALLEQAAPVTVNDGFAGHGTPGNPASVSGNAMYVGHLANPGQQAFFSFQAGPGDQVSVSLSHLSRDYDLVLYAPTGAQEADRLRSTAPFLVPLGKAPLPDPLAGSGNTESLVPEALQDIPLVSNRVVAGISDFRGTEQEYITTTGVSGNAGSTYLVQVSANNSANGREPFVLTIRTSTPGALPACSARTFPNTPSPTPLAAPVIGAADNTLVIVDQRRLEAAFGTTDASLIMSKLQDLVTNHVADTGVQGKVLDLSSVATVNTAFAAADQNPCSPATNNNVVRAINDVVDGLKTAANNQLAGLQNIVLVGEDDIIPHARILDGTTDGNERDFAGDTYFTNTTNQLGGAFGNGYFLSDTPYSSLKPLSILGQTVYPMQVALGRLGGSASTIESTIDLFVASKGMADPRTATSQPRTALETDYGFFRDGGALIHQSQVSQVGAANAQQLTDATTPWDKTDLTDKLINDTGPGPKPPYLISPNAHYDQYRLLPAKQNANGSWQASDLFTTQEIEGLAGTPFKLRLLYGIGCHFGLDFPDSLAGNTPTGTDAQRILDWEQAYFDKGAAVLVGNLGFGFGDTATVAFSERLMANFAANLDGSMSVGQALVKAEKDYLTSLASFSPYDQKVLEQTIMWGFPMYKLPGGGGGSGPAMSSAASSSAAAPVPLPSPDPGLANVDATTVGLTPTFTVHTAPDGSQFYDADGLTQSTHPYPIMPKTVTDLPADGPKIAKGALLQSGTISEQSNFDMSFANATIDNSANEPATAFETIYPTTHQSIGTFVDQTGSPTQTLVVLPGMFRPDSVLTNSPSIGTFRKLTASQWQVTYGDPNDVTGPQFVSINGSPGSGSTQFSVNVAGAENDDQVVVVRVVALYIGGTTYQTVNLTHSVGTLWTGSLPSDQVREFTVFALDSDGNVATANNRGLAYAPVDDTAPFITRSIGSPKFISGNGLTYVSPSTPITVTVGDLGSGTCSIEVFGPQNSTPSCHVGANTFTLPNADGPYLINVTATDSAGNTFKLSFDLANDAIKPDITITRPAAGATYGLNEVVTALSACSDAGSGVATCTKTKADGQAIDTATIGQKPFTVTATDNVGNSRTTTINYFVGYKVCLLYDPTKPFRVNTATIPIKLQICDATGKNLSSASITLTAVALQNLTAGTPVTPLPPNAGDGFVFRFDKNVAKGGGYIYNLSTKGLAANATFELRFKISNEATGTALHVAPFSTKP